MKSLAVCVVLLGCDHSKEAKRFLEANGYTDVVVTPSSGDKVGFTAKSSAGQHCRGTIDVEDEENSSHTAICAWECTPADWKGCSARAKLFEASAPAKAVDDYVTGCEAGDVSCCARAGVIYEQGIGVAKNEVKAFVHMKKACDGGDAQSCASVAVDYSEGIGTGKDPALAVRAADMACTHKVVSACKMAGTALVNGIGVPRDAIAGVDRLDKGCMASDYGACTALGVALVDGRFVAKDLDRGEHLLDFSCKKSERTACFELGRLLADKKVTDPNGATASSCFRRGCDLGDAASCQKLALR